MIPEIEFSSGISPPKTDPPPTAPLEAASDYKTKDALSCQPESQKDGGLRPKDCMRQVATLSPPRKKKGYKVWYIIINSSIL